MARPDPLVAALDDAGNGAGGGRVFKVDILFGDRPDVIDAIKRARDRGVRPPAIAEMLSSSGERISEEAVRSWLKANPT